MQGAGNDFVVIDATRRKLALTPRAVALAGPSPARRRRRPDPGRRTAGSDEMQRDEPSISSTGSSMPTAARSSSAATARAASSSSCATEGLTDKRVDPRPDALRASSSRDCRTTAGSRSTWGRRCSRSRRCRSPPAGWRRGCSVDAQLWPLTLEVPGQPRGATLDRGDLDGQSACGAGGGVGDGRAGADRGPLDRAASVAFRSG